MLYFNWTKKELIFGQKSCKNKSKKQRKRNRREIKKDGKKRGYPTDNCYYVFQAIVGNVLFHYYRCSSLINLDLRNEEKRREICLVFFCNWFNYKFNEIA